MATMKMLESLPALEDDECVGKEMQHTVRRDDEPDLKFTGTLLASSAPDFRDQLRWKEYRVYRTKSGNLVLSVIGRSVKDGERDKFHALVYLVKDEVQYHIEGHPLFLRSFQQAVTDYFKFDDVAKRLYSRLGLTAEKTID